MAPVKKLVESAQKIGTGDLNHRIGMQFKNEFGILSSEFDLMAENLKTITISNKEKEVLLREIHHRVKNNLQMIKSLLNLQFNKISDSKMREEIRDSMNRITSIALVHETLYKSDDLSEIDQKQYFEALIIHLFNSVLPKRTRVTWESQIDDLELDLDTTITCGLIMTELVTNSLKYAFKDDKGKIIIQLNLKNEDTVRMQISDNGIGLPDDVFLKEPETLGLTLVKTLAINQLNGLIDLELDKGSNC